MLFVVSLAIDYKNATKGLLGTWNDNPDDDFALPDGSVLQTSSTARAIHFEFGVKCKHVFKSSTCMPVISQQGIVKRPWTA